MSLMLKAAFKGGVAMKGFSTILSLLVLAAVTPAPVLAEAGAQEHVMISPSMVKWQSAPPGVPTGAEFAVLSGDPSQEGKAFVIRLKFPANYQVPAHWHLTVETVTVLSGTFNLGLGDQLDRSKTHALEAGSLAVMPANTNHFGWTDTETVIQIHGMGPFALNYVNPADDPRQTKSSR
jgi:quercetin dioxygenase-like cupin family protein